MTKICFFCLDDSFFGHIYKQQMTDLILINNEDHITITYEEYTMNFYATILAFFENLKHLTIVRSSVKDYPPLSLYNLSSTTFSSSTLTKLCIDVDSFDDCLALFDGRLKNLTTCIVQISYITDGSSTSYNMVSLCSMILSFSN
jgi:hypothetical protein